MTTTKSVALPVLPVNPEPINPPTLTAPLAPGIEKEKPKALLKRSKEVAREVKRYAKENPGLTVMFDRKPYPCREIVQFCAACFAVTAMVTRTEEVISDDGAELGFVAIAHAVDQTGRVVSGAEAACMYSESDWGQKPSYQLRSMAQTRACSKVLCNLFAYVLRMAGFCPTPAEEMGSSPTGKREREITTPCYECGNKVTKKRALETRRKYGKELCLPCANKADDKANGMHAIADPQQVSAHIAEVKKRKANGAQPIVAAMDHVDETEIPA